MGQHTGSKNVNSLVSYALNNMVKEDLWIFINYLSKIKIF